MRKNIEKYVVHNKKNVVHVKDIFLNIKYDILLKSVEICNMIFHTIFLFYITMEKEEK